MNGSIGASLFYGVSCLIIYIAILLYPRKQKKEALITGLALSAVILESYIAFVGAIINILHIPPVPKPLSDFIISPLFAGGN